jgi:hypothetical protein
MRFLIVFCSALLSASVLFAQNVKIIEIAHTSVVYVPQKDRIYFTTPTNLGARSNSICVMDTYFGKIEDCYFVGSDPVNLTASDDGKFLYFTQNQLSFVSRFNLDSNKVDLRFNVGSTAILDIDVLPGQSDAVAVTLNRGVSIYKNGVQLPNKINNSVSWIQFIDKDSIAFVGYYGQLTSYKYNKEGISLIRSWDFDSPSEKQPEYANDKFFFENGAVLDVSSETPIRIGTLTGSGPLEAIRDTSLVYFTRFDNYSYNNPSFYLEKYSIDNFSIVETTRIQTSGYPRELLSWGDDKFIVSLAKDNYSNTVNNKIVVINDCVLPSTEIPKLAVPSIVTACSGSRTLLAVVAKDGQSHYWSTGEYGDSIYVSKEGLYDVSIVDSTGCLGPKITVSVKYQSVSTVPYLNYSGERVICSNESLTLSALGGYENCSEYMWSNGERGNSIKVTKTGSYAVRCVSSIGCFSNYSASVYVTVIVDSSLVKPEIKIEGDTLLCFGDELRLTGPEGYSRYIWNQNTSPNKRSITISNIYNDYYVKFGVAIPYYLQVESEAGCLSEISDTLNVYLNPELAKPTVLVVNNLLASSTKGESYNWYFNDELIEGANDRFLYVSKSGFYAVEAVIDNCSSAVSDLKGVAISSNGNLTSLQETIALSPNPVKEQLSVHSPSMPIASIRIFDGVGRLVKSIDNGEGIYRLEVDMGQLATGFYFVKLYDENNYEMLAQKVVKVE